jgi:pimeloyl-ACP methyl ester carboxylesterase
MVLGGAKTIGLMVRAGMIRLAGLEIAYDRAVRGPPLVLVHGAAGDAREWGPQVAGLCADFTVIAWDEPGAGRSSDVPPGFGLGGYATALAASRRSTHRRTSAAFVGWHGRA